MGKKMTGRVRRLPGRPRLLSDEQMGAVVALYQSPAFRSNADIGRRFGISHNTVRTYIERWETRKGTHIWLGYRGRRQSRRLAVGENTP